MQANHELISSLLFEEESTELDVKREQYPFVGATEDQKSELLKDILALANAWRRSDAYILVGVEEVKGARNHILGITELLDDAPLQQFVNSKTQRPLTFLYCNVTVESKTVGVFHIPVQQRPFYLTKDYGKLKAGVVYLRRGTSTDVANPDEIARIGAIAAPDLGQPNVQLLFADPEQRAALPEVPILPSCTLILSGDHPIPDYSGQASNASKITASLLSMSMAHPYNRDYYRELVRYIQLTEFFSPLYLALRNAGDVTAYDVRVELIIPGSDSGISALDRYRFPSPPTREYSPLETYLRAPGEQRPEFQIKVRTLGDKWLVETRADKVQPNTVHWIRDAFFLGAKKPTDVLIDAVVTADNISSPLCQVLRVKIAAERREVTLDNIVEIWHERFRASPEYRRYLKSHEFGNGD